MIRGAKLAVLMIASLAICSVASAQRAFNHAALHSSAAHVIAVRAIPARSISAPRPIVVHLPVNPVVRRIVVTPGASAAAQTMQSDSVFNSSNSDEFSGSQVTLGQLLNPVPGLGFDFSNLAAINHDLAVRALIDPITQQELALSERLLQETPVAPVSFPFFGSESQPVVVEQQPPQVILVQTPPAQQQAPEASAPSAPSPAAEQSQPPLPDIGEFVLVLHDGTKIKAVAFTRQNDRIVYITKDGLRHSFSMSALDPAATQRLNEQRGTPLQLPL
ncbi:MAG: hypothetical protein ACYDBL_11070 [Candidatus Acidiferrales bacterium]